jgi:calcineurin-like phosphoesterase family protein
MKFNSKEDNIFFSADFHYGHKNICRGISRWTNLSGTRNFNTLEEMNKTIVNGINNVVGKNDILFFLGDWSFGEIENIWNFRKQINCQNIYFISGNHDDHIKKNKIIPNAIFDYKKNNYNIKSINNKIIQSNQIQTTMLFDYVDNYMEMWVDSYKFVLNHRPIKSWNDMNRGSIHLYGHTHANYINEGLSLDVGIDMAYKILNEYRPFSYQEIKNILKL